MESTNPVIIRLKVMTPIFIGNGDAIKPLSYIQEGPIIHVLDSSRFFKQLTEGQRQSYLDWIDPILDRQADFDTQIAQAGRSSVLRGQLLRQRRQLESTLSCETFIRNCLGVDPVRLARSNDCIAYSLRCETRPGNNGFRLFIKNAQKLPYIPGTEIKGALRTSLLFTLLSDRSRYDWFRGKLEDFRSTFISRVSRDDKIKKFSAIAPDLENHLIRGKKNDAKFDLLKFVWVSDASPLTSDSLRIELIQSMGTTRYTKTWVETLIRDSEECRFRLGFMDNLAGERKWVVEELGLQGLEKWFSVPKLLEACFVRSKAILENEVSYFSDESPINAQIDELQKQNQPDSPLLRLGSGQGFLGTTVNLHVKNKNAELYDGTIREGVSLQRRWQTQKWNFPKTRRVVTNFQDRPTNLLGWVKLLPEPLNNS